MPEGKGRRKPNTFYCPLLSLPEEVCIRVGSGVKHVDVSFTAGAGVGWSRGVEVGGGVRGGG